MKIYTAESLYPINYISDIKAASRNLSDVAVIASKVAESSSRHQLRRAFILINLVAHNAPASAAVVQEID